MCLVETPVWRLNSSWLSPWRMRHARSSSPGATTCCGDARGAASIAANDNRPAGRAIDERGLITERMAEPQERGNDLRGHGTTGIRVGRCRAAPRNTPLEKPPHPGALLPAC